MSPLARALFLPSLVLLGAACSPSARTGFGNDRDASAAAGDGPGAKVCSASDPAACDGDAVKRCRSDGSGYDFTPCPEGASCQAGACGCVVGAFACMGSSVVRCGEDGALHVDHACPAGTMCAKGLCTDPRCDEELSSTNPHGLPVEGWPRYRHDNRNSGSTPAVVADTPQLKWKVFVGGSSLLNPNGAGLASGAVVNQGNVSFIGAGEAEANGGALHAYDGTGKSLFTFGSKFGFGYAVPAVRLDGTVYFSAQNAKLYAVDPAGNQAWSYQTGSQADADAIVTKDGIIVYASDDGHVYALDPTGKVVWSTTGPGEVDSGLAESCDGRIYAAGTGGFHALDAKTGATLWKIPGTGLASSPLLSADGTMFAFDGSGNGMAVDPKGNVLWKDHVGPGGPAGASVARVGDLLFTVLNDAKLHAVDAKSGVEKWSQPVGSTATFRLPGPVVDGQQRLYVNSNDGFVYSFDTAGKARWKIATSGVPHTGCCYGEIAIGKDGTLYVPGNDGTLYALK